MSFTIYEHVNKYNNKKYIGITSKNTNIRWGENGLVNAEKSIIEI